MAINFVLGHVIYSFCAPIALAEAWRPELARRPWLSIPATVIAAIAYLGAAAMIMMDPESASASPAQLVGSLLAASVCAASAVWIGARHGRRARAAGRVPGVMTTMIATLVLALLAGVMGETWTGVAVNIAIVVCIAVAAVHAARRPTWGAGHAAAIALGFLLCRGLLALTYFPLVGEISAVRKYSHNVVMLVIVGLAGWRALRRKTRGSCRRDDNVSERG
jgi:hypothetical protein